MDRIAANVILAQLANDPNGGDIAIEKTTCPSNNIPMKELGENRLVVITFRNKRKASATSTHKYTWISLIVWSNTQSTDNPNPEIH